MKCKVLFAISIFIKWTDVTTEAVHMMPMGGGWVGGQLLIHRTAPAFQLLSPYFIYLFIYAFIHSFIFVAAASLTSGLKIAIHLLLESNYMCRWS